MQVLEDARIKWWKWFKKLEAAGRLDTKLSEEEVKPLLKLSVPHELRPQIWPVLSGALRIKATQSGEEFGWGATAAATGRGAACPAHEVIAKSMQEPYLCNHAKFEADAEKQKLEELLKMFALRCHLRGQPYGPSLNLIAGLLQVVLDDEVGTAFWVLSAVVEALPLNYFGPALGLGASGPSAVQIEVEIFLELAQERYARLFDRMHSLGLVKLEPLVTPWFENLFVHCLSWPVLLNFVDCLLVEGIKAVHRFGLAIFQKLEKHLLAAETPDDITYELGAGVLAIHDPHKLIDRMLEVRLIGREVDQRRQQHLMRASRDFPQQQQQQQMTEQQMMEQQMMEQQQQQQQQGQMGRGGWGAAMGAVRQQQGGQQQQAGGGGGAWGRAMAGVGGGAGGGGGGGGMAGLMGVVQGAQQQQQMAAAAPVNATELTADAKEIVREAHRMAEELRAKKAQIAS